MFAIAAMHISALGSMSALGGNWGNLGEFGQK